jgi:ATP:corrinoid adenosyltransferase
MLSQKAAAILTALTLGAGAALLWTSAEVVAFLKAEKPPMTHVVLTGRNAAEELI